MNKYEYVYAIVGEVFERCLKKPAAIYVVGSYGRQEGVLIEKDGEIRLYNDLDLLVVNWECSSADVESIKDQLRKRFKIKWIDIDCVTTEYFKNLPSSCYSVDLRLASKQISGGSDFRDLMAVKAEDIADNDIRKLFYTRGWCALGVVRTEFFKHDLNSEVAQFFRYQIVKMIFAGIDIFLIRNRHYVSSYLQKINEAKKIGLELKQYGLSEELLLENKINPSQSGISRITGYKIV